MPEPLDCQRAAFRLPRRTAYLNCAYAAPFMRSVEAAGIAAIRRRRDPSGIVAPDYFAGAERARAGFARLIGLADPARVAIVSSVSYGMAIAARNLPVGRGQNIVVAGGQFPSNVYAWQKRCRAKGAEFRMVEPPPAGNGRGARWNERLLEAIDGDTAVVALGTVDWSDGTIFDLEAIGDRARAVNAAYVLDGIQSVGALPFDVERVRPDLLVCSAYKWLCGPIGVGVAYLGPSFDEGEPLEETWLGRRGSEDFRTLTAYTDAYQCGARRYDMGGRAQLELLPMLNTALEQLAEWTPERIQAYCARLRAQLLPELERAGFGVDDAAGRCAHLFALRCVAGTAAADVQQALRARRVHVSARGEGVRISLHVYNDEEDLDRLVKALAALRIRGASQRLLRAPPRDSLCSESPVSTPGAAPRSEGA